MIERSGGHGGGDNPYFIEQMHRWLGDNTDIVVYHSYFDRNPVSLTQGNYPASAARFRELFATAFADIGPPPTPVPLPPPAPVPVRETAGGSAKPRPTVRIVKLKKRRLASGARSLRINVRVRAPNRARRVAYRVNGRRACVDKRAPYRCGILVRKLKRGKWNLVVVKVTDRAGKTATTARRFRV